MLTRSERIIMDAARRSVRRLPRIPEPREFYRADEHTHARWKWLAHIVTAPAKSDPQAPLVDAMAIPVALTSLVLPYYAPVCPDIHEAMHQEAVAQAPADVAQSLVRQDQSPEALMSCLTAMVEYRVSLDRAIHCVAARLGKTGLPESLSFTPRAA